MECRGIILNLTAETHRAKRVIIFYFVADPPKKLADRKAGK
jgi:hypothetical protein